MRVFRQSIVIAVCFCVVIPAALATNGMYLVGYGTEANGRGGANIAVCDRALGLQANPAGMAQLIGNHFSVDLQLLLPKLHYSDPFGNSIDAKNRVFAMPAVSYVRGGSESRWSWGIGMISQGGMGATFEGYSYPSPPFPPVVDDQTFSEVRFASINPSFAYSFTNNLSIGFSAILGYSDVEFRFWPETSTTSGTPGMADDFYGLNLTKRASTFNYAARAGLLWRVNSAWQLGFVYQTKTESDYDDGELLVNASALNMGDVRYGRTTVNNFTWPEQIGAGLQFRPSEKGMIAFDAKLYRWSDAIEVISVVGNEPDNAMFPPQFPVPFVFNWDDQLVLALGGEYRLSDALTLRGGYNHGDSPVPDETLNPLFPATPEDHLTFGLGYNWGRNTFNFAVEHAFEATQTNNNTNPMVNPFGPGATIDHSQWTISVGYSLAFSRKSVR